MLETPQAIQHDAPIADTIDPNKGRSGTRSYRDGYPEGTIDRLDLQHVESSAFCDGAFAAALERAIEAGTERDIAVTIDEPGTERPTAMIVPSVHLPEQVPALPARNTFLAYRLARRERAERTRETIEMRAERAGRWLLDLGTLTVLDLRAGLCRFSTSETSPYFFCGAGTGSDEKSYCPHHDRVCHPRSYQQP